MCLPEDRDDSPHCSNVRSFLKHLRWRLMQSRWLGPTLESEWTHDLAHSTNPVDPDGCENFLDSMETWPGCWRMSQEENLQTMCA